MLLDVDAELSRTTLPFSGLTSDSASPAGAIDAASRSYGHRLGQHIRPEFHCNIAGREQIDTYPQQFLQLVLNTAEIEQRCAGQGVDQNVDIAVVCVLSPDDRTEDARIRRVIGFDNPANFGTVSLKGHGRSHGNL